tara:strand:- start:189 stop:476 length:288 start_codon:yes stop_codon:yes gene_type:complete
MFFKNFMSTEFLIKENLKNLKFDPKEREKTRSDLEFSNLDLNKVQKHTSSKNKSKICINTLNKNLRQKEIKEKFENRVLFGLVVSAVAVLFYVST